MEDILCMVAMAVVGALLGIIAICACMSAGNADADSEREEQARELLNLRLENEYLHMWQVEARDSVNKMEPPEGFPPVYCRGCSDMIDEIRRIVN